MTTRRFAFTMIELVFVIVILGILAAVAIPKLAATRTDAQSSALAQGIMTGVQEVSAYAVSNGETNTSTMQEMSNSFATMQVEGKAVLSSSPTNKAVIASGNISDCITVDINTTATDDILQMIEGNASGDVSCLGLQRLVHAENYPIKLRGANAKQ